MPTNDDTTAPRRKPSPDLAGISTSWRQVRDPARFVATYAPAVRKYLLAILDEHDTDEVLQDLLVRVTERGFGNADPARGRFRDYLRTVVRNAARQYLRRKTAGPVNNEGLDDLPASELDSADSRWRDEWRRCVLEQALRALDRHQQASPGNLYHTVIRLTIDHPGEDSVRLAARVTATSRRPVRPEAFRQQLTRARRMLAELLVGEIRQTLADPTPDQVRSELADLDLLGHIRDYLPNEG